MNATTIVDSQGRVRYLDVGQSGVRHDLQVWQTCTLYKKQVDSATPEAEPPFRLEEYAAGDAAYKPPSAFLFAPFPYGTFPVVAKEWPDARDAVYPRRELGATCIWHGGASRELGAACIWPGGVSRELGAGCNSYAWDVKVGGVDEEPTECGIIQTLEGVVEAPRLRFAVLR